MLHSPGTVGWIDLTVGQADQVRDFYRQVVGWGVSEVEVEDHVDYSMTADGVDVAGVCWRRGVNANVPAGWIPYFVVTDLEASLRAVREGGGEIVQVRQEQSNGIAMIKDPSGAVCALWAG